MQRERTADQYPWTWEIPAGVALVAGLVVVWSWQLARSLANWTAGAGWVWPAQHQWFASIPGLLQGDARAGLTLAGPVAAPVLLWSAMVALTVLALTAVGYGGLYGWRRWGGGAMRGMATTAEAHRLLGADRLRRVRHLVRPDLYPPRHEGAHR